MINKNIEDAKNSIHNMIDKASIKAKNLSLENKLQLAFYKLGEAVYNAEYSDAKNRPDSYSEIINEIDEIMEALDEQEAHYNELNNKTRCLNCGNYSSKDVPCCAYCGAKKVSETTEESEMEEKSDECTCGCDDCDCCNNEPKDSAEDSENIENKD